MVEMTSFWTVQQQTFDDHPVKLNGSHGHSILQLFPELGRAFAEFAPTLKPSGWGRGHSGIVIASHAVLTLPAAQNAT